MRWLKYSTNMTIVLCFAFFCFNALGAEPKNAREYYKRGWERLQSQNWEGALDDFTRTIELKPKDSSSWLNRGLVKQNLGDLKGAHEDYSRSIQLEKKNSYPYYYRGQLRYVMGDYKGALEDLNLGIRYLPKRKKYNQFSAMVYIGRCMVKEKTGDIKGASEDWQNAVKLNPLWENTVPKPGSDTSISWQTLEAFIDQGDVIRMQHLLTKDPAFITKRSSGPIRSSFSWTLLHEVTLTKNVNALQMCRLLIESGAEINVKDSEGNTPLHFSVDRERREKLPDSVYNGIIDLLLDNGADVGSENMIGATPLHLATMQGADSSVVEKLIAKGADINAKTFVATYTPLHGAASEGRTDLVEVLLKHGANPDLKDGQNLTPPEIAKQQGHQDTVEVFRRLSDLKAKTPPALPAVDMQLLEAARTGDNERIPQLLDMGANPNARDEEGYRVLMLAVKNIGVEAIKALVDSGADLEDECYLHGATALGLAVEGKRYDIIRTLLNAGANVNAQSYNRATPLITAAAEGDIETARILLDAGADINICNMHNKSPLFAAAQYGHSGIVKLLLDAGADVNIRDFQDKTALEHASEKGHTDIAEMIRSVERKGVD